MTTTSMTLWGSGGDVAPTSSSLAHLPEPDVAPRVHHITARRVAADPAQPATRDLNVIRDAILQAQRGGAAPLNVYADPAGAVVAGGRGSARDQRISTVVGDTFFVDLNAIQAAVLAAQASEGQVADKDRVYVDQQGEVMLGSDVADPTRYSAVVGDTFYARDLVAEAETVRTKLPAAVKVTDGTYEGYAFSITNMFNDKYDLFIYYHPVYKVYRVALVQPRLGGELDVHGGHLYSDGTLCLTRKEGSGYKSMDKTYAKAAVWTLGASLYRRGYGFQFNLGQEGDSRA